MTAQITTNSPPISPLRLSRQYVIGGILLLALISFEIFNFDTTQYALINLLGDVSFVGLKWATILAIAFCAIDFAGLARIFTPQKGRDEPNEVWYLMGAWLLGATMNAVMTWWAISLTLLDHEFGNEVLSRTQLLTTVPIFVAVLVWLTRILFIGAISVAGDHWLDFHRGRQHASDQLAERVTLNPPIPSPPSRPPEQPTLWTDTPPFEDVEPYATSAPISEPLDLTDIPLSETPPANNSCPHQTRRPTPTPRTNYRTVPPQHTRTDHM